MSMLAKDKSKLQLMNRVYAFILDY